jgi:hypothetical protein
LTGFPVAVGVVPPEPQAEIKIARLTKARRKIILFIVFSSNINTGKI